MFDSTVSILSHYLEGTTKYDVHSVEKARSENPNEAYYLCLVNDTYYIVVETDYVGELSKLPNGIVASFLHKSIRPIQWIAIHSERTPTGLSAIAYEHHDSIESLRSALILKPDNSFRKYAVLEVAVPDGQKSHFDPTKYGHTN